jgi:hypothetical protein
VFSELLGKLIFELSDSIDAADARDELFGALVPCPFQVNNAVLFVSIACLQINLIPMVYFACQ